MTIRYNWLGKMYGISAVRYDDNSKTSHIEKVRVHEIKGNSPQEGKEWTRKDVIDVLEKKPSVDIFTIRKKSDGKWTEGTDVHIFLVDGTKYIRTDQNSIASDNLENLPEF